MKLRKTFVADKGRPSYLRIRGYHGVLERVLKCGTVSYGSVNRVLLEFPVCLLRAEWKPPLGSTLCCWFDDLPLMPSLTARISGMQWTLTVENEIGHFDFEVVVSPRFTLPTSPHTECTILNYCTESRGQLYQVAYPPVKNDMPARDDTRGLRVKGFLVRDNSVVNLDTCLRDGNRRAGRITRSRKWIETYGERLPSGLWYIPYLAGTGAWHQHLYLSESIPENMHLTIETRLPVYVVWAFPVELETIPMYMPMRGCFNLAIREPIHRVFRPEARDVRGLFSYRSWLRFYRKFRDTGDVASIRFKDHWVPFDSEYDYVSNQFMLLYAAGKAGIPPDVVRYMFTFIS